MSTAIVGGGAFRAVNPRHLGYALNIIAVFLLFLSFFAPDSIAYLCVAVPVLIPAFMWVGYGAFGIPVLPVVAILFYVYYALPLLGGNTLTIYKSSEIVWAALSVGYFLIAASVAAWPFLSAARYKGNATPGNRASRSAQAIKGKSFANIASTDEIYRLIFIGLTCGVIFNLAAASGKLGFLGTFAGVVRACVFPLTYVACYLTGFSRGAGALTGPRWVMALGGFLATTTLSMSSLFLVGGAMNIAALMLGYVLGARRIPWVGIGLAFVILSVLNAGKGTVRESYWELDTQTVQNASLLALPGMLTDWFIDGLSTIASIAPSKGPTLLERTSLLHMVLAVQQATPTVIPFLNGATYAMLPSMLVPRFLQPDKIESQAVLNLLSVRYGRETEESTSHTTIGWGMVAEGYANYGNLAVVAVGLVFGALCGLLMRLSATAGPTSMAMLIAIASTLTLCNVESDFSYTMVTLFQTVAGVCIFAALPRLTTRRSRAAMPSPVKRMN
jgi:hypothetical protein